MSEPQVARKYFEVAKSHGEQFVAEARAQARRFDPKEFDSILACSRLLSVLGFAFLQIHRSNGVTLDEPAAWTWLHLLRGVVTVFDAVREADAELDPIMSINMVPEVTRLHGDPTDGMRWHRDHMHFAFVRDTQKERIETLFVALDRRAPNFAIRQADDFRAAIVSLNEITSHICNNEVSSVFRAVATWPGSITHGFMDMLLKNEPFALAIYGHWLMLVALLDHLWWFDDMGLACITEIANICARDDPSLSPLLRWPKCLLDVANA